MPTVVVAIDSRRAVQGAQQATTAVNGLNSAVLNANRSLIGMDRQFGFITGASHATHSAITRLVFAVSSLLSVREVVKEYAAFEKELINVSRTAELGGAELRNFGNEMRALSRYTPQSAVALLDIAQVAGTLGVRGSQDLSKFTDTVARLGTITDIRGEEAVKKLARVLELTGEPASNVDKLGSAIARLSKEFQATGAEVTHTSTTLGTALAEFKLTSAEVSALGAVLAGLGVRAELGGFAVGRAFHAIQGAIRIGGRELTLLSQIIGETPEQIQAAFGHEPLVVMEKFLDGLNKAEKQGTQMSLVLENLGLSGQRDARVIPLLAARYNDLARALKLAREEQTNPQFLNRESEKIYQSLSSRLIILKNSVVLLGFALVERFLPQLNAVIETIRKMTGSAQSLEYLVALFKLFLTVGAAVLGLKLIGFFLNLANAIWQSVKAMISLTPAILGVLAVLAALELGRYFYDEFEDVRNTTNHFLRDFEIATEHVKGYWKDMVAFMQEGWEGFGLWFARAAIDLEKGFRETYIDGLADLIGGAAGQKMRDVNRNELAILEDRKSMLTSAGIGLKIKQLNEEKAALDAVALSQQKVIDEMYSSKGWDADAQSYLSLLKKIHGPVVTREGELPGMAGRYTETYNPANDRLLETEKRRLMDKSYSPALGYAVYTATTKYNDAADKAASIAKQIDELSKKKSTLDALDPQLKKNKDETEANIQAIIDKYEELDRATAAEFAGKDGRKGRSFSEFLKGDLDTAKKYFNDWLTTFTTLSPEAQKAADELKKLLEGDGISQPPHTKELLDELGDGLDLAGRKGQAARERIQQMFDLLSEQRMVLGMTPEQAAVEKQMLEFHELLKDTEYRPKTKKKLEDDFRTQLEQLKYYQQLEETFRGVGDAASQAFDDITIGGKTAADTMKDLIISIERLVLKLLVLKPLSDAITSGLSSAFNLSGLFGGGPAAGEPGSLAAGPPSSLAASGLVMHAAGGRVLTSPTYFPSAGVVAGESGAEGLMPLQRNSRGDLGVTASGLKGDVYVQMTVVTPNVSEFNASSRQIMADVQGKASAAFAKR